MRRTLRKLARNQKHLKVSYREMHRCYDDATRYYKEYTLCREAGPTHVCPGPGDIIISCHEFQFHRDAFQYALASLPWYQRLYELASGKTRDCLYKSILMANEIQGIKANVDRRTQRRRPDHDNVVKGPWQA